MEDTIISEQPAGLGKAQEGANTTVIAAMEGINSLSDLEE